MKKIIFLLVVTVSTAVFCNCSDLFQKEEQGEILIYFEKSFFKGTRASADIPDEGDFLITVTDSGGNEIFSGTYASSPETIKVDAGSYTVSAISRKFEEPLYDAPQFGDSQVITVASSKTVSVQLNCRQLNCGVRISLDPCFRTAFPEGVLYLSGASGMLMYGYSEHRTAYFKPGGFTLSLHTGESERIICTRTLEAEQMLSLNLSANLEDNASTSGISLQIDTARNWISESIIVGDEGAGSFESAYDVVQAREHIGEKNVWVSGYLVGVATNTNKFSFTTPFSKNTNVVIGLRSTSTDSKYLMAVELPKGDIRDELNLQYNPDLLGKKILLKGTITAAYYGIPGIKDISSYEMD